MALWQFIIEVVPSERVQGRTEITQAEFDQADWWSDRQPPAGFRQRLAALLPATRSWHERLLLYGEDTGDRFDVWLQQDRMRSFTFFIDCREANQSLLEELLRIAQDWSCAFVERRYLKVLPLNLAGMLRAISESPNCRFMDDPAYWLPKLAAELKAKDEHR